MQRPATNRVLMRGPSSHPLLGFHADDPFKPVCRSDGAVRAVPEDGGKQLLAEPIQIGRSALSQLTPQGFRLGLQEVLIVVTQLYDQRAVKRQIRVNPLLL